MGPDALAVSGRLEALGRPGRLRGGGGYESYQRLGGVLLLAGGNDAARKQGVVLNRSGKRTQKVDTRCGDDLADLVEADLDIAAGDRFESFRALLERDGLRFHGVGDAQPFH